MKCYLCAISCGVGAGRSVGRKKGKKENHFLNSSYNVWKTFVHSIHLSGFHVITPGRKNNPPKKEAGGRQVGERKTGMAGFNGKHWNAVSVSMQKNSCHYKVLFVPRCHSEVADDVNWFCSVVSPRNNSPVLELFGFLDSAQCSLSHLDESKSTSGTSMVSFPWLEKPGRSWTLRDPRELQLEHSRFCAKKGIL